MTHNPIDRSRQPRSEDRSALIAPPLPKLASPWTMRFAEPDNEEDVNIIHGWMHNKLVQMAMNKAWTRAEWREEISTFWQSYKTRPYIVGQHLPSYGHVDGGYAELYRVAGDVVADTYTYDSHDLGLHGCIGDLRQLTRVLPPRPKSAGRRIGLALEFWIVLLDGIFKADPNCQAVVSDPDAKNSLTRKMDDQLTNLVNGQFVGEVRLPHKQAALYRFSRDGFEAARTEQHLFRSILE